MTKESYPAGSGLIFFSLLDLGQYSLTILPIYTCRSAFILQRSPWETIESLSLMVTTTMVDQRFLTFSTGRQILVHKPGVRAHKGI